MLPCADGWFAEMVWEQNPLLYQLVFLGSLLDLLSLPLFAWRYTRLTLTLPLPLALTLPLTPTPTPKGTSGGRGGCTWRPPRGLRRRLASRRSPARWAPCRA